NLSNINMALVSEAARVARDIGAPALVRVSMPFSHPYASYYGGLCTSAMIVAKSAQALAHLPLQAMNEWFFVKAPDGHAWTDDYINIPRALLERPDEKYRLLNQ
ncbi:MAG: hypothetical protein V1753_07235, partial [Pseudomonadota bacterium]